MHSSGCGLEPWPLLTVIYLHFRYLFCNRKYQSSLWSPIHPFYLFIYLFLRHSFFFCLCAQDCNERAEWIMSPIRCAYRIATFCFYVYGFCIYPCKENVFCHFLMAINSTFKLSFVLWYVVVMQQVDLEIPAKHNQPLSLPLPQASCASCQNVPVEKGLSLVNSQQFFPSYSAICRNTRGEKQMILRSYRLFLNF